MQTPSGITNLSMAYTCRTCLSTDSSQRMIPIFEDHQPSGKFAFDLLEQLVLLKLKIAPDDGLPANICEGCTERLEAIAAFQAQCEKSQELLSNYLAEPPEKHPEGDPDEYVDLEYLASEVAPLANSSEKSYQEEQPNDEVSPHMAEDRPPDLPPHVCPVCQKTFQTVSNRNTHLELHRTDPIQCGLCEQVFRSKRYLAKHTRNVHTMENHRCEQCGGTFTSTAKYEYHLRSHEADKKYKCSFCRKSFLQQHHLLNHERTHTGSRPFLCNVCGKDFKHEPSFKTHLRTHDGLRPHGCDICPKAFAQRSTYEQHMARHRNIRAFQCEKCGKNFVQRNALDQHLKTHKRSRDDEGEMEKVRPSVPKEQRSSSSRAVSYGCDQCNRTFRLPSSLTSHMKVHNEDRKYVCGQCGNTFKRAEHLRVHINGVHLKRKPYSCEICSKTFAQSGDRNAHMRTHTAEKPHQCGYCGKGFSLAKALRAHVRLHTGERPFVCIICGMSFISYTALASHTQKHQEEEHLETSRTESSDCGTGTDKGSLVAKFNSE